MRARTNAQGVIESPAAVELGFPATDIPSYIFHHPRANGDHVARYLDAGSPDNAFDLAQAELYVKQFAKGLQDLGFRPGDKVALCSPNQLYSPVVIWGVLAAQCVFTGVSPTASAFELAYQVKDSGAKALLASHDKLEVARKAATEASLSWDRVFAFDRPGPDETLGESDRASVRSWTAIWAPAAEARDWKWKTIRTLEEAKERTAVINYSSGTTGLPKGVEISHFNLVSNVEQLIFKRSQVGPTSLGRDRAARLRESGERWLASLPMYHAFGQAYYTILAPRIGAKVFVMGKFDAAKFLAYIDMYRITFINVVPTMLRALAKVREPGRSNLSSLSMVGSGAAPLDTQVARQFERMFLRPGVQVKQGWGMTETTVNATGFAPDDVDDGRSIGWLNPGCKGRIVPVPDRDFGHIERERGYSVGEIWVSGPNIMKGYWGRPEVTREVLVEEAGERWLRTGDVGYFDQRGCLFIVDRIKELIKVKGLQVSPAELEQALTGYPGVADAAVVGVKIAGRDGVRAFVVRENEAVTAEALDSLIRSKFASHKWLTGGIYFTGSIPRTGSGKVMKRALPNPDDKRVSKL